MQQAIDKPQSYTRKTGTATKTAQTVARNAAIKQWLLTVLMLLLVLILDYPIFVIFLNAFRSTAEILATASIIPQHPTLANFSYLSARTNFWGFFVSSLIVAGLGTVISIICAAAAGYALSRYHILPLVSGYSRALMMVQMFPLILALIPLFIIFHSLGLVNTYYSVILVYTVLNLPSRPGCSRASLMLFHANWKKRPLLTGVHAFGPSPGSCCRSRVLARQP